MQTADMQEIYDAHSAKMVNGRSLAVVNGQLYGYSTTFAAVLPIRMKAMLTHCRQSWQRWARSELQSPGEPLWPDRMTELSFQSLARWKGAVAAPELTDPFGALFPRPLWGRALTVGQHCWEGWGRGASFPSDILSISRFDCCSELTDQQYVRMNANIAFMVIMEKHVRF